MVPDYEHIGETVKNPSSTTSMKFLSREPQDAKYPPRRHQYVGLRSRDKIAGLGNKLTYISKIVKIGCN